MFGDIGAVVSGKATTSSVTVGARDEIWGQTGNDILFGGAANDDLYGEAGDDILLGDFGSVSIGSTISITTSDPATGGADKLIGGAGQDRLEVCGGICGGICGGG